MDNQIPNNGDGAAVQQSPAQPIQQPAYQAPPQPAYQQPVCQVPPQPVYQQPVRQAPPQPVYQQPVYKAPPQPVYQQPVRQAPPQPVYQQPVYQVPPQPVYQQLVYQAPPRSVYSQPVYHAPLQKRHNQQRRVPVISLMMLAIWAYQCVNSILKDCLELVWYSEDHIPTLWENLLLDFSMAVGVGLMLAGFFRYKDGKAILFGSGVFTYAGAYLCMTIMNWTDYSNPKEVLLLVNVLFSCLMIAVGVCYFVRRTSFPTTWKTVFCIAMLSLVVLRNIIIFVNVISLPRDESDYYFLTVDEEYYYQAIMRIWYALDGAIAPVCLMLFTPAKEQNV